MFLLECPHCQRRELRGYRGLRSLTNTADGIVLEATCTACGELVTVLTGRTMPSTAEEPRDTTPSRLRDAPASPRTASAHAPHPVAAA